MTVKPIAIMRWLVKLVVPPQGVCLDPFAGSFTTAMACIYENRKFIMIEREEEYVEIGVRRARAVAPLFADEDELTVHRVAPSERRGDE